MNHSWPWITLALLGAYHGINPGMGWLFAVSLGLQERSRKAVLRAFAPIAAGHFASIAVVVGLVAALQNSVPPELLRCGGAAALVAFGVYKLAAPMSHPRWVGMRVGSRQLAFWSFLMATAHGAGLMVAPVVIRMGLQPSAGHVAVAFRSPRNKAASLGSPRAPEGHADTAMIVAAVDEKPAAPVSGPEPESTPSCHAQIGKMADSGGSGVFYALAGAGLHTLAMFLAMALVALAVFERIGLKILRTAWYNLDLVWAAALIGAGVLTLVL